jgi:hypothetical protein
MSHTSYRSRRQLPTKALPSALRAVAKSARSGGSRACAVNACDDFGPRLLRRPPRSKFFQPATIRATSRVRARGGKVGPQKCDGGKARSPHADVSCTARMRGTNSSSGSRRNVPLTGSASSVRTRRDFGHCCATNVRRRNRCARCVACDHRCGYARETPDDTTNRPRPAALVR